MFASRFRGAVVATLAAFALLAGLSHAARATLPDSTAFTSFIRFAISPPSPCVNDTLEVVVTDDCPQHLALVAFHSESGRTTLRLQLAGPAAGCLPRSVALRLGRFAAGHYTLMVEVHVSVPSDSVQVGGEVVYHQLVSFDVATACVVPVAPAPFVQHVVVGAAPCTTCDPRVCAGQPFAVTVSGAFPNSCWHFDGLDLVPSPLTVVAPPTLVVREHAGPGNVCATVMVPFSGTIVMPALPKGTYTLKTVELRSNATDSLLVTVPVPNTPFAAIESCTVAILPTPVIQKVTFGTAACDSCAPNVCPGAPMTVTVSGSMPNACWTFAGLSLLPTMSPMDRPVVVANFRDPCPSFAACTGPAVPFSGAIDLSPGSPGARMLGTWVRMRSCTDSTVVSVLQGRNFAYAVLDSCPVTTALTPVIEHVTVGDSLCGGCGGPICGKRPMQVTVSGRLPNACWAFGGLLVPPLASPIARPVLIASFRAPCSDSMRCTAGAPVPFTGTISISPGPAGPETLLVWSEYRSCTDSSAAVPVQPYRVAYTVTDSCAVPPVPVACVFPFLEPMRASTDSSGCDLTLAPGATGAFGFGARSEGVPIAGLQGAIVAGPRLRILTLRPAVGFHLAMNAKSDSVVTFALYADHGAPIPAGTLAPALTVIVVADSALGGVSRAWVAGGVTSGSDSLGNTVPICPIMTLRFVAAQVCFARPATCDVNADGRTDVADLVRMARCWFRPGSCPDTLAARPDCNGDGAFHVDDILCCARAILGGGGHDSTHAASRLHVALGAPHVEGGDLLQVPLEISGATEMNGALLHVKYPSDRYMAVPPVMSATTRARPASAGTSYSDPWLPLTEIGDADVVVGVLRLDSTAPDVVTVPLYFRLRPDATPGGDVTVDQSDVNGADGSTLTVSLDAATAPLPTTTSITRVDLLVGPNPSRGPMSFVVRLPQVGHVVDLALFDLAGRRVATLAHGAYPAGEHGFTWTATGARSGVFFARLSVDGVVRTSRVVMQFGH